MIENSSQVKKVPLSRGRWARRVGDEVFLPDGRIVKRGVGDEEIRVLRPVPLHVIFEDDRNVANPKDIGLWDSGIPSKRQTRGRR